MKSDDYKKSRSPQWAHIICVGGLICSATGCGDESLRACAAPTEAEQIIGACASHAELSAQIEVLETGTGKSETCTHQIGELTADAHWMRGVDARGDEYVLGWQTPAALPIQVGATVSVAYYENFRPTVLPEGSSGWATLRDESGLRAFVTAGRRDFQTFVEQMPAGVDLGYGEKICAEKVVCGRTGYHLSAQMGDQQVSIAEGEIGEIGVFDVVHAELKGPPLDSSKFSCNGAPEDFAVAVWRAR